MSETLAASPAASLDALLVALSSDRAPVKLGAIKALRDWSGRAPDRVYPYFDVFVGLLRSEHSVLRWNAMLILGDLAAADREARIDRILDEYLAPITGPHMIDAANTIRGATAIAEAKPSLADRIAAAILKVERANYATPECRSVAIGHAINSLDRLFPMLKLAEKRAAHRFVERQMSNTRAATRKKAEKVLRKWPITLAAARA